MDRMMVYPGAIPLDTDILRTQVNTMVGLGALIRAALGTGTYADGFAIAASTVPDMNVNIGPGSLTSLTVVDTSAYGSVTSNAAPLMKQGINLGTTTIALTAPGTVGQSRNYLIQATFTEADGTPVVLPYYNAANPSVPYSGPAGAGTPNNTVRAQTVVINAKAGVAATTGSQTTPSPDSGYVGLYVVTVANGQTSITTANLANARLPGAPFLDVKVADLQPMPGPTVYASAGANSYTVPNGVTRLRYRLWGGGGGGGGDGTSGGGGGGGGGGYAEGILTVTPGQVITATVGAAGTAGTNSSGTANGNSGGNGGDTTIAGSGFSTITAGGGQGGQGAITGGQGNSGPGGSGSGGQINMTGGDGNAGLFANGGYGGNGGSAANGGGGGAASTGQPSDGNAPGGGGAGGGATFPGGAGAAGMIVLEPIGRA